MDGHNIAAVIKAFDTAASTKGKPTVLIAKTLKGLESGGGGGGGTTIY